MIAVHQLTNSDGEATGGSAYCAIAALRLMDRLDALPEGVIQDVIRWSEARCLVTVTPLDLSSISPTPIVLPLL